MTSEVKTGGRRRITSTQGALPPNPRGLTLYDHKDGGIKKRPSIPAPASILTVLISALGSLLSVALSSG